LLPLCPNRADDVERDGTQEKNPTPRNAPLNERNEPYNDNRNPSLPDPQSQPKAQATSATGPAAVIPFPTHPDSLAQSDVASLRAFLPTLSGIWECAPEADADGDLWAALVPHHAGHDGYGATFILARHGASLTLTDASGQTLGRYDSVEQAEDALGEAVGYRRQGHHR
jgi:hypothetical protein